MSTLDKYTDEELFQILDSNVEEEIKHRGYEYGWHKKVEYAGVIYILVNPAFPKLVKIGYADNVEKRVKTLNSNSGLPDPYHVYATYKVKKRLEDLKLNSLIDSLDSDLRHSRNREFYEMSPEQAYSILSAIAQINGDEDLLMLNPFSDTYFAETKDAPVEKIPNSGEKPASEKKRKRSRLTFEMLGIPVGSELTYRHDHLIKCITADNISTVLYKGQSYTLSGLVTLLEGKGQWHGGDHFLYNGKRLTQLRYEMEKQANG